MEMNICMAINRKPCLSPIVFANLQCYAKFKENFHHVSIRAQKHPTHIWYDLPYLEKDDAINAWLDHCLEKWHNTSDLEVGVSKSVAQCKREEAKLKMVQLDKKRKKEVIDKA